MSECIFCKIANGEIKSEILYKDEQVVAFKDISPRAAIHFLIIPVKHISTVYDLEEVDNELVGHIFQVAKKLADEYNIAESGYRLVVNCKEDGGQEVFHLHFHLLGGEKLGAFC